VSYVIHFTVTDPCTLILTHDVKDKGKRGGRIQSIRLGGVVPSPAIGQADTHPRVVTVAYRTNQVL